LNLYCIPRIFFNTQGGRIGQGPQSLKPDDIVCLIYGGTVPYILRSVDDGTFTFVGHCFVQRVMDGEGMDLGHPEEVFLIR
jgi:hypothetical protein